MHQLDNSTFARQDARTWSERLGTLAAQQPGTNCATANVPLDSPSRLAAILHHFRQRQQRREDSLHTLRANEFVK